MHDLLGSFGGRELPGIDHKIEEVRIANIVMEEMTIEIAASTVGVAYQIEGLLRTRRWRRFSTR